MGHDAFTGLGSAPRWHPEELQVQILPLATKPYLATNIWKTAAFNVMKAGLVIRP